MGEEISKAQDCLLRIRAVADLLALVNPRAEVSPETVCSAGILIGELANEAIDLLDFPASGLQVVKNDRLP